ncbi:MAG: hypothetical protein WC683_07305 [bacterium]
MRKARDDEKKEKASLSLSVEMRRRLQEVADREEEGNVSRLVAKILTLYFNNRECADVAMIDYDQNSRKPTTLVVG